MTEKEIKSEITEKLNQGTSKSVLYDQFKDEIKDESLRKISLQTILWTKAEIQKNPFVSFDYLGNFHSAGNNWTVGYICVFWYKNFVLSFYFNIHCIQYLEFWR